MNNRNGIFIVIDGIAGSGKSTILRHIQAMLTEQNISYFDSQDWFSKHTEMPEFSTVDDCDIYFTIEPTKAWTGSAIRKEISFYPNHYSAMEQAHAFSLDRHIQYRRFILPALESGKIIIQDRSVSTSIVYQGNMDGTMTQEDVMNLPGNAVAIQQAPDHLILTHINADIAVERLNTREDTSKGMYGEIKYLMKFQDIFHGTTFQKIYTDKGTDIHTIDTSTNLQTTLDTSSQLFKQLLNINS